MYIDNSIRYEEADSCNIDPNALQLLDISPSSSMLHRYLMIHSPTSAMVDIHRDQPRTMIQDIARCMSG
jgi:hypothetical protein